MKHYNIITCPHCGGDDLVKNGHRKYGTQCWRCNNCKKYFQFEFRYNARKPGIKEQIIELTMNSSGVRDISRTLKINKNTVIAVLKKNTPNQPLPN
jgi:transposase-like protein